MLFMAFSSKMRVARVSSIKPIAIDQKVMDTLENLPEFFLVKITENARLEDEARVRREPIRSSEFHITVPDPFLEKRSTEPPISPNPRDIHLKTDSFSPRIALPRSKTIKGEMSIIAAERPEEIYFSPASCIG